MLNPLLLLCENCGYNLEGLPGGATNDPGAKCPECGRPVAESLPEHRIGSAWQRNPRFASWLGTNVATLRWPEKRWRRVEVEYSRSASLLEANIIATAIVWALAATVDLMIRRDTDLGPAGFGGFMLAFIVLNALSFIEWCGIRVLAWRRGWRIDAFAAWAIVGHASIGWVLGAIAMFLGVLLASALGLDGWGASRFALATPIGAISGLLCFETLVYLGFRQMRYANRARETEAITPAPPSPPRSS